MTDLVERTIETTTPEEEPTHRIRRQPPIGRVPRASPPPTAPWPSSARIWVVVLAVIALLGAFGTVIGFMSGGEDTTAPEDAQATIEALTAERADLVAQATDLQATIDTLTAQRTDLQAQLETVTAERTDLQAQLETVTAERTDLQATIDTLTAERTDLQAQLSGVQSELTSLTADRDAAVAEIADLEAALTAQTQATTAAIAQRNALAKAFPLDVEASLDGLTSADLVGTYDVELTKAFCGGFASCATVPAIDELTLRTTPEGWLQLVIPNVVTAGLFRVDGALYAIADGTLPLASCGGVPRAAEFTVTIYAQGLSVAADGTAAVTGLAGSLTVQALATASCPTGLAFYGAQITPQA
jgi:peptidoglycan hydrolase CwlO-like protein